MLKNVNSEPIFCSSDREIEMNQIILKRSRGQGNRPAFYIIDRRVLAMQVPGFYVTEQQYATRMDRIELDRRLAHNEELRNSIESGNTEICKLGGISLEQRLAVVEYSTNPRQCYEAVLIKAELARRAAR
jgi:hypothetical protein